jgi:hypothetical protein
LANFVGHNPRTIPRDGGIAFFRRLDGISLRWLMRSHKGIERRIFTSAGDAKELYCHMDAEYEPISHVFGNIAYSFGGGGLLGSLKTLASGEINEIDQPHP